MKRADKTLAAIDAALERDGGKQFRVLLKQAMSEINDAFSAKPDGTRFHLGASKIGHECDRAIWFDYRHCNKPKTEARMIRLFNRGHLEEARFAALLRLIGIDVKLHDDNGHQFHFDGCGGHFAGSCDGILTGVPELPGEKVLAEFKTHNDDSFKKLEKFGVKKTKPEHFAQVCVYMKAFGLKNCLYMAVNKNNDALYAEILTLEEKIAALCEERAIMIISSKDAPEAPASHSPAYFKCKFCSHYESCHFGKPVDKNCLTCAYCAPIEGAKFYCYMHYKEILRKDIFKACENYEMNRSL